MNRRLRAMPAPLGCRVVCTDVTAHEAARPSDALGAVSKSRRGRGDVDVELDDIAAAVQWPSHPATRRPHAPHQTRHGIRRNTSRCQPNSG